MLQLLAEHTRPEPTIGAVLRRHMLVRATGMRRIQGVLPAGQAYAAGFRRMPARAGPGTAVPEYRFVRRYLGAQSASTSSQRQIDPLNPQSHQISRRTSNNASTSRIQIMNLIELNRSLQQLRLGGITAVLETRLLQRKRRTWRTSTCSLRCLGRTECRSKRLLERRHKQAQFRDGDNAWTTSIPVQPR